jgi:hypothetical protein
MPLIARFRFHHRKFIVDPGDKMLAVRRWDEGHRAVPASGWPLCPRDSNRWILLPAGHLPIDQPKAHSPAQIFSSVTSALRRSFPGSTCHPEMSILRACNHGLSDREYVRTTST